MIQIAGGVVWNKKLGIAVVNQNNNSWSLPKGHVEEGETHTEAAVREIEEETGIPAEMLTFIRPLDIYERDQIKRDVNQPTEMRTITMFLFTTSATTLKPLDPENPEARWVPINEVSLLLSHQKDRDFFDSINWGL